MEAWVRSRVRAVHYHTSTCACAGECTRCGLGNHGSGSLDHITRIYSLARIKEDDDVEKEDKNKEVGVDNTEIDEAEIVWLGKKIGKKYISKHQNKVFKKLLVYERSFDRRCHIT